MPESKFQIPDGPEINIRQDGMLTNLGLSQELTQEGVCEFITAVVRALFVESRVSTGVLLESIETVVGEIVAHSDNIDQSTGRQVLELHRALMVVAAVQKPPLERRTL